MYIIKFGKSVCRFRTWYHTDQFCRALELNGINYTICFQLG